MKIGGGIRGHLERLYDDMPTKHRVSVHDNETL